MTHPIDSEIISEIFVSEKITGKNAFPLWTTQRIHLLRSCSFWLQNSEEVKVETDFSSPGIKICAKCRASSPLLQRSNLPSKFAKLYKYSFFVGSKQHGHSSHWNVRKNLECNLHDFQYNEHPSSVVCIFYRGETPAAIWRLCISHFISLSTLMLTSMDSYLHIISPWGSGNQHILRYSNLSAYVYSFVTMAYSTVFLAYVLKSATFS